MKNKMYAYIAVRKFKSDPDRLTERIGLKPTGVHRKGEVIRGTLKRKFNS